METQTARRDFPALLLAGVRDAVVGVDLAHRVTYWNRGAAETFGYIGPLAPTVEVDDGVGVSLANLMTPSLSALIGMLERPAAIGAAFDFEPSPSGGRHVRVRVPLARAS
jgi:hypothetical protein